MTLKITAKPGPQISVKPVRPPTRLLLSFCSWYNAWAYNLIYRVAIVGVYTRSIYLSVPLQASYPSHEILPNGVDDL
jgi:hypothetical protein